MYDAVPACRVGFGMDSHRFMDRDGEKKLMLGGIMFPGHRAFLANSDGDVVLHALVNAVSQALGGRSIGHYADPLCERGITDSAAYVDVVVGMMEERGYALGNIGIMLEGASPRIAGSEDAMKARIGEIAGIPGDRIGITATSGEGLTEFGKGMGMQCFCNVMLIRKT